MAVSGDQDQLPARTRAFYQHAMATLREAGVPFLVGGAYAFAHYTGIVRHTKDFDLFVRPRDAAAALDALAAAGYHAERSYPFWLGKAYQDDDFVDIIYRSQNGVATVDDRWFDHAVMGEVFGHPVPLAPAEEILWTKALVQERERYDGADVAHLIRARGQQFDWTRLLDRFGPHWRILLSQLILFGYCYPSDREQVPNHVLDDLLQRLHDALAATPPAGRVCFGTILSRAQYLIDVNEWGYQDARLHPIGNLTPEAIAEATEAIADDR